MSMALDRFVTLGRSGLRVSPLCLGAMTFGQEWGMGCSPEESAEILSAYLAAGGNFVDTANIYTKGHSEKIIGDYFASGPGKGRRDRVVIATKFGGSLHAGDPNGGGSGRKSILSACEQSLRRLRTDHIDLYWAHFWDAHTPLEEMLDAVDALVRAGKIRHFGLSDHPAWVCANAATLAEWHGWPRVIALQIEYSLLQRTVEAELMSMARHFGMGVTPWGSLRGGVLSGKFSRTNPPKDDGSTRVRSDSKHLNERTFALLDALSEIAGEVRASVSQVSLAWVLAQPGVTSVIIGARRMSQLKDNLGAVSVVLSPQHRSRLDALTQVERPFPWEFLETLIRHTSQNGTTINGVPSERWALSPEGDHDRH